MTEASVVDEVGRGASTSCQQDASFREQAKSAITQVQSIINGCLTNEINNLNAQGAALSDLNSWDGPLAERLRSSTWPETKSALAKVKVELEELRGQLQQISIGIMTAGGGS